MKIPEAAVEAGAKTTYESKNQEVASVDEKGAGQSAESRRYRDHNNGDARKSNQDS